MIEGATITCEAKNGHLPLTFDSSNVSFVFCGSFEHLLEEKDIREETKSMGFNACIEKKESYTLYSHRFTPEDLVQYAGIRQEIAGRIHQIVQLYPGSQIRESIWNSFKTGKKCKRIPD